MFHDALVPFAERRIIKMKKIKVILSMIAIICVVIILGVYIGQKSIGANTFTGKYTTGNLTWKFAGSYSKTTQEKLIAYPQKFQVT